MYITLFLCQTYLPIKLLKTAYVSILPLFLDLLDDLNFLVVFFSLFSINQQIWLHLVNQTYRNPIRVSRRKDCFSLSFSLKDKALDYTGQEPLKHFSSPCTGKPGFKGQKSLQISNVRFFNFGLEFGQFLPIPPFNFVQVIFYQTNSIFHQWSQKYYVIFTFV